MNLQSTALLLMQTRGIGPKTLARILALLGRSKFSLEDFHRASVDELVSHLNVKPEVAEMMVIQKENADRLREELDKQDIQVLVSGTPPYPAKLERLLGDESPPVLFVKGNLNLLARASVGFCGSRKATHKGLEVAFKTAHALSECGITIVSGYAHGVDLETHAAAMRSGGSTIFVLAEGILNFRVKREVKDLLNDSNHAIISEFSPKLTWNAGNAMRRNRVICALSKALVLIESSMTGGTFAAGKTALDINIPLFVADYSNEAKEYEGNQYFLTNGATALRGNLNGDPTITNVLKVLNEDTSATTQRNGLQSDLFV